MLEIDFVSGTLAWRRRHGGGRGEAVAKAVGLKKATFPYRILDCTAGLGRDAFLLATLGCDVLAVERNEQLAKKLINALEQTANDPDTAAALGGRLRFIHADSIRELPRLVADYVPQVLYLDPMHPARKKSALVKQELRQLRALVGEDPDSLELAKLAIAQPVSRIVIKRPAKSEPLLCGENYSQSGKTTRFDIYLPNI